jgi:hypothetical protein
MRLPELKYSDANSRSLNFQPHLRNVPSNPIAAIPAFSDK